MISEFLLSPQGALTVAALTTVLAWAESTKLPWAPFLILYAIALPAAPLALGSYRFGSFVEPFHAHGFAIAGLAALILLWEIGIMGFLYEHIVLPAFGICGSRRWSPAAAMDALLETTARVRRLPRKAVMVWYGFYFIAWAPLAEELFFWGYCYPVLRGSHAPVTSSLAVALVFGIRHGLHFLFLPGPFPWPAAAALMASAAGAAFLNGFLYEAAGSLWPLVLLHLLSNLLALAVQPGSQGGQEHLGQEPLSARTPSRGGSESQGRDDDHGQNR